MLVVAVQLLLAILMVGLVVAVLDLQRQADGQATPASERGENRLLHE